MGSNVFDTLEIFPWNYNLETGNEKIDKQHKRLVVLRSRLANQLVSGNVSY